MNYFWVFVFGAFSGLIGAVFLMCMVMSARCKWCDHEIKLWKRVHDVDTPTPNLPMDDEAARSFKLWM